MSAGTPSQLLTHTETDNSARTLNTGCCSPYYVQIHDLPVLTSTATVHVEWIFFHENGNENLIIVKIRTGTKMEGVAG